MTGIVAYGAYIPRLRLQRSAIHAANRWFAPGLGGLAKGERAIANWDEDTVTMAVEAARDCLAGRDRGSVRGICLASTSAPFADRQNAGIVKEALNLDDAVSSMDVGASRKAGTGALLNALRATAGGGGEMLVVAGEKHRAQPGSEAEMTDGAAAAAMLVGTENVVARFIGAHSLTLDFVDQFRSADREFDYVWENRWIRDEGYLGIVGRAIGDALSLLGCKAQEIAHLIVPVPGRGIAETLAGKAGIAATAVRDTLAATVGHAGAAHPLLMLADALAGASPGDRILVVGFGQGADVLLFEATDAIVQPAAGLGVAGWLSRRRAEDNYMKYLAFSGHLKMDLGMRAEFDQKQPLTALYRNRRTVLGLVGGRCTRTGAVQFPRSEISVAGNAADRATQEDYPLADIPARVVSFTADQLGYTPDPPGYYGLVDFEGGGRMVCEFTDVDAGDVEVGRPMRMSFRIKAVDERRGFIRYFWKAVPQQEA